MQYDKTPFCYPQWQQYNTCLATPAVTGKDTARLNPKLSTSPIARTTNLVGQTKKDNSKRLAKITQSYIKEFREESNIFHR